MLPLAGKPVSGLDCCMRYGILSLTVCLCAAWAQDPATLDKVTSTINAKVTSAAAREYCICELQPDLW